MLSSTNFQYSNSTLARGLRNYPKYTRDRLHEIAEDVAREMEDWAKKNAKWENRTGDARAGLTGEVSGGFESWGKNAIRMTLSHSVDYGIWLEIRWSGKFAIVIPSIEKFGPKFMKDIEGITGDIIYYA